MHSFAETSARHKTWRDVVIKADTIKIPRSCRMNYIATWDNKCKQLYNEFTEADVTSFAEEST